MPVTFKLSHKNIRARYQMQKRHDPSFSHRSMGAMFGRDRLTCYKWCRVILDENKQEIKDSVRCPMPTGIVADKVMAWINDGVLAQAMERMKAK